MLAILVVIVGSVDQREAQGGILSAFARLGDAPLASLRLPSVRVDGLRWAVPKTDRLLIASGASVTKSVILDHIRQRRGSRDYMMNKPYARLAARLAPLSKADAQKVPPFNPFKLYANPDPVDAADRREDGLQDATTKLVELLGGILPTEDGQELTSQDVTDLVARHQLADDEATGLLPGSESGRVAGELLAGRSARAVPEVLPPNTTALQKTVFETEDTGEDLEGREVRVVRAQKGDTLSRVVLRLGAEPWQARAITDAAKTIFADTAMLPGQEVHVTLVPSVTRANRVEPVRFSVFGEGHDHKVTIARDAAGEFVASASPIDERVVRAPIVDDDQPRASSLYTSLHYTAERQGVPADVVLQILKIHAYETDFRQRVRVGDGFEFFFDVKDEDKAMEGGLGELLATSVTASGETHKFYRFRSSEGVVDYYDEQGNTSRKFLMRRPVRGEDVRITSGFGVRRHPDPADPQDAHRRRLGLRHRDTDHGGRQWRHRGGRPQGRVRQLHPHSPCQRLQDRIRAHVAARSGRQRGREGATGPDHRLRWHHRTVLRAARPFRGAGQQQFRRSDVDPGHTRAATQRQAACRLPEGAGAHRRAHAAQPGVDPGGQRHRHALAAAAELSSLEACPNTGAATLPPSPARH